MDHRNCWEILKCGRQPQGDRTPEYGVCPAALDQAADGINHGVAGGRICWTIEGTFCSGTRGQKLRKCLQCPVFQEVENEEGRFFVLNRPRTGTV